MKAKTQSSSQDVINDLLSLIQPTTEQPRLERERPKGPLSAARGYAEDNSMQVPGVGGGIASPLTEQHFSTREYWEAGIPSSDGLFMYPAPKKVKMTDATGAEVIFDYADPSAPVPVE